MHSTNVSSEDERKPENAHQLEANGRDMPAVARNIPAQQNSKAILNRLSKATGHLIAVRRMVEDGRDCSVILLQLAAVRSALTSTCKVILKDHINRCVAAAVRAGDMDTIRELRKTIEMLTK